MTSSGFQGSVFAGAFVCATATDKGIAQAATSRATRKRFFDKGSPIREFCGASKHVMKCEQKNSAIDAEWEWCSLSLAKRKRPWEQESNSRCSLRRLSNFFAN